MDSILLLLHIFSGTLGLITGTIILFLRKGDQRHKLLGRVFGISLALSMLLSFPFSILHKNYFLFSIGVWTLYMIVTAYRFLHIKSRDEVRPLDWLPTLVMIVFGLALLYIGGINLLKRNSFGWVAMVFGAISLMFVLSDFRFLRASNRKKKAHLLMHIQRMMGAYIASLTAFLVVNNSFLPGVLAWLLPSLIITPLIFVWSRKYG
jgi:uncharacterized membrane protein